MAVGLRLISGFGVGWPVVLIGLFGGVYSSENVTGFVHQAFTDGGAVKWGRPDFSNE